MRLMARPAGGWSKVRRLKRVRRADDANLVLAGAQDMSVVLVGRFTPERLRDLGNAVAVAGQAESSAPDAASARHLLGEAAPPSLIAVDGTMPELGALLTWVRGHPRLVGTMVVAVVPAASERAFVDAHLCGADDVVLAADLEGVTRRVRTLVGFDPTLRPVPTLGKAVIGHPGEEQRRLVGRLLRLAGFEVMFAGEESDLEDLGLSPEDPPAVLVLSDRFGEEGGLRAAQAVRQAVGQPDLPCVLLSSTTDTGSSVRVAAMTISERAPADNLLFAVTELLRPTFNQMRASARVLHGALCSHRLPGGLQPALSLTYNLSREGMYLRSLDPPEDKSVLWVELRPPGSEDPVHLRAQVVTARRPGSSPGGSVPPGFALRLTEESCPPPDLLRFQLAYSRLRAQVWRGG
jgi:CheY-like chemotaxis protein